MATDLDDLTAWIDALHGRVAHGDLHSRATFRVGADVLTVKRAARILLADVDHDDDLTPEQRSDPFSAERRRLLFSDLRRLRAQIR